LIIVQFAIILLKKSLSAGLAVALLGATVGKDIGMTRKAFVTDVALAKKKPTNDYSY